MKLSDDLKDKNEFSAKSKMVIKEIIDEHNNCNNFFFTRKI